MTARSITDGPYSPEEIAALTTDEAAAALAFLDHMTDKERAQRTAQVMAALAAMTGGNPMDAIYEAATVYTVAILQTAAILTRFPSLNNDAHRAAVLAEVQEAERITNDPNPFALDTQTPAAPPPVDLTEQFSSYMLRPRPSLN